MNHETFFKNYELLIDASNSVEELRELILQLAVEGKLVPQDPNEETSSVLFEKIIADKERLIKEKKFKKSQTLPEIETDEIPFDIPKTWKWIRLNDVGDWGAGSTPDRKKPEYYEGSILWFKSGELNDGYIYDSEEKITEDALKHCSLRSNKPGDVLIAMYGATIGKVAILEVEATTNQAVCACTCFSSIYNCYLFYLLKAYRRNFSNQGVGGAQPNISRQKIIHTVAPLPPYEEQKRIVTKVDQLMALCDQLEARQQKKHEKRIRLNNAALDKLLTAPTPREFAQHWQRICDNFDLLYDAPEIVGQLQQAILQLAVQGKLVAQDEGDEPAAVLVEKIKTEKERLIQQGKIKKSKTPSINIEKFPLPEGWIWVRLGTLCNLITKGSSPKWQGVNYVEPGNGVLFITSENVRNYNVNLDKSKYVEEKFNEIEPRSILKQNDILMNIVGASIGRTAMYDRDEIANINQAVCLIRVIGQENLLNLKYLLYFFNSPLCISFMFDKQVDNARANLSMGNISKFHIPLPPFEEQKRIVAKVDQLMALCDELEAGLVQTQTEGGKLMEAVVHHVLAG